MAKTTNTPRHADDRALDTVSLRDYFAAAALQGLMAAAPREMDADQAVAVCQEAYNLAEGMLVERQSRDDADDMQ